VRLRSQLSRIRLTAWWARDVRAASPFTIHYIIRAALYRVRLARKNRPLALVHCTTSVGMYGAPIWRVNPAEVVMV
jgi:hypothetical protein